MTPSGYYLDLFDRFYELWKKGRVAGAIEVREEAVEVGTRLLGPNHPDVQDIQIHLGWLYGSH